MIRLNVNGVDSELVTQNDFTSLLLSSLNDPCVIDVILNQILLVKYGISSDDLGEILKEVKPEKFI